MRRQSDQIKDGAKADQRDETAKFITYIYVIKTTQINKQFYLISEIRNLLIFLVYTNTNIFSVKFLLSIN